MKFTVQTSTFVDAIATVSKAISSKPTMPVLEGILMSARDQSLTLQATDLSLGISLNLPVTVETPGDAVLQGRLLLEIVRRLPQGELVVDIQAAQATLSCLESRFNLSCLPVEEFPELPQMEKGVQLTIPCQLLSDMIQRSIFSVAVEESRQLLTGELFDKTESDLNLVALDGNRMALITQPLSGPAFSVVVPGKTLQEVAKILPAEGTMQLAITQSHMHFLMEDVQVTSRLLSGEYTNYRALIPGRYTTRIEAQTDVLRDCVERASLLARDVSNNLIRLSIQEQRLVITSRSQSGDAREEMPLLLEGELLEICFNARLLSEILKQIDSPSVVLTMTGALSPCTIVPGDKSEYLYILMPVRMR